MFLRGAKGNEFGRFGTSLAAVQDLNGDGFMELAVGAPQEEQGKGAIYIFLGRPGGIRTGYSQVWIPGNFKIVFPCKLESDTDCH